jgi:DnaK suppressor protein
MGKHRDLEKIKKMLVEEKHRILNKLQKDKEEEKSNRGRQAVGDDVDQAVALEEENLRSALSAMEVQRLRSIEGALQRIEEGTYGYCEECGEPIEEGRLMAKPFAVMCVRCKEEKERKRF